MRSKGIFGALALGLASIAVIASGPLVGAASAEVEGSSFLAADVSQLGVVNLAYLGKPGSRVDFAERRSGRTLRLGSAVIGSNNFAVLLRAATWRCDHQIRAFSAVATAPDGTVTAGTFTARTPSCKDRLQVSAARVARSDRILRFTLRDRWELGGVAPRICLAARSRPLVCHTVTFRPGVKGISRRFGLSSTAAWRAEVRIRGQIVERLTGVSAAASRPKLLATGDSTIQGVDVYLADRLRGKVTVSSESRPGTGLSRSTADFDWRRLASDQVRRVRPWATVVSIGVNEGYEMMSPSGGRLACCGAGWVAEYARRARTMMLAYGRAGAARTLWLELPVPRNPALARVVAAVNRGIAVAARAVATTRVVELSDLLSPNGRYAESILRSGRRVRVRQADGIHLSPAGAAIAADAVVAALRADPPPAPPVF